jgi:hypothetical protein
MVAWRLAIRVHRLVLDHEVDDFSAGPLLLIPSAPKQTLMFCGSFRGFSRRRANAHRSGAC